MDIHRETTEKLVTYLTVYCIVSDIMITHMIRCQRVIVHHHTVQKMPFQLVATSTRQMAHILSTHLGIDLMEALTLRCALF